MELCEVTKGWMFPVTSHFFVTTCDDVCRRSWFFYLGKPKVFRCCQDVFRITIWSMRIHKKTKALIKRTYHIFRCFLFGGCATNSRFSWQTLACRSLLPAPRSASLRGPGPPLRGGDQNHCLRPCICKSSEPFVFLSTNGALAY